MTCSPRGGTRVAHADELFGVDRRPCCWAARARAATSRRGPSHGFGMPASRSLRASCSSTPSCTRTARLPASHWIPRRRTRGSTLNFVGSEEALGDPHAFAGLGPAEGFPPTLIVVCEHDELRPSGEAFARSSPMPASRSTLHLEAGAGHGHINEPSDPTALPTVEAIAEWIGASSQQMRRH